MRTPLKSIAKAALTRQLPILLILLIGVIGVQTITSCTSNIEPPPPPEDSSSSKGGAVPGSSSIMPPSSSSSQPGGTSSGSNNPVWNGEPVKKAKISGVSQKGPFIRGSSVILYELNSDLSPTGRTFQDIITDDRGKFEIKGVELVSPYALLKANGNYRNEVTGNVSDFKIDLYAITDIMDKDNVNVNVLTHLEYYRVLNLVENGKSVRDAKKQAQKEILAVFGISGDFVNSEDMSVFGTSDGDAALLAISILLQGNLGEVGFEQRLTDFRLEFAENGKWNNENVKTAMVDWALNVYLKSIRNNILAWGLSNDVPAFEKHIINYITHICTESRDCSTFTDTRDNQQYLSVKIGEQTWMKKNLNYDNTGNGGGSICYDNEDANCARYGRLYYGWDDLHEVCPSGWHLPTKEEWDILTETAGGSSTAGKYLKATSGWNYGNGTNAFGFTALPGGGKYGNIEFRYAGSSGMWWSATSKSGVGIYYWTMDYNKETVYWGENTSVENAFSVRCVKGMPPSTEPIVVIGEYCNRDGVCLKLTNPNDRQNCINSKESIFNNSTCSGTPIVAVDGEYCKWDDGCRRLENPSGSAGTICTSNAKNVTNRQYCIEYSEEGLFNNSACIGTPIAGGGFNGEYCKWDGGCHKLTDPNGLDLCSEVGNITKRENCSLWSQGLFDNPTCSGTPIACGVNCK